MADTARGGCSSDRVLLAQNEAPAADLAARLRGLEAEVARLKDKQTRGYLGLHHPLDAATSTFPPRFEPPVILPDEPLPLPPPTMRFGYAPGDDRQYLQWGRHDHDFIIEIAGRYLDLGRPLRILDFGCSSGRVLRHFEGERQQRAWRLHGVDTQALAIEWMRSFWPTAYCVCTSNEVLPVLPFESDYFDLIYGISAFTRIKYHWDGWLSELRRRLKPGGLCLQTVNCESAWSLYARGEAQWQIEGAPDYLRQHPEMDVDYLFYDFSTTSSTFYKRSAVEAMFGRYMPVREILEPPQSGFRHWVVMQKPPAGEARAAAMDRRAPRALNLPLGAPPPKSRETRMAEAHAAITRGDWETAAAQWEAIRREAPDLPTAYLEGGWALREAGRLDEADRLLSAGVERFADNEWIAVHYGWVAMRREDWAEAALRWERVRARFPGQPHGYVEGGWALREAGRFDEADLVLQNGMVLFPDNPWPAIHHGWVATRRDWPEAARRWDAVRMRFPDQEAAYVDGGWALLEAGRLDDADRVLAAAVEKFPESSSAALHYARVAARQARHREAVARWQAVAERFPNIGGMPQEIRRALVEIVSSAGGEGALPGGAGLTARIEAIRGLSNSEIEGMGLDRLTARIQEILADREFESWPVEKQLPLIERVHAIYTWYYHRRGYSLIPALERLFHRALADPEAGMEALGLFFDLLYFLYWYVAADHEAMRGMADRVMRPFAAAVRTQAVRGLPPTIPRLLGRAPLRLGYLSQFAALGNPIGRGAYTLLRALAHHFPETYRLALYAWSEYNEASLAVFAEDGILVREFAAGVMTERLEALAQAIATDRIDILITDMNSALPTALFERRAAPIQIFYQMGMPYWPLANIDGVFRIDCYDSGLDGFDPDTCFSLGLGPWDLATLAPQIEPARIAVERAGFPRGARLIGFYGRLVKVTPEYLEIVALLVARHPDVVVILGGTGDGAAIRDFIAARQLSGRVELVEGYVEGHVWGHLLEVFLDTFPQEGNVSCREMMAKDRPVVNLWGGPWSDEERIPMLVAQDATGYLAIASRLIEDRKFYEAACAATREFVASRPREPDYAAAIDQALSTVIRRSQESR